jgi:hypothetical protein
MSETLPNEPSAIVYRRKKSDLTKARNAVFGGAAACAIILPLIGLPFGGGVPLAGIPCLIIGAALLSGLGIVVRAERRGRPCLVLREDRFTYLGYLKVKDAKWSDLGVFRLHEDTPRHVGDDSSNASSERTCSLRAWVVTGASGGAARKKPDFVVGDHFDVSLHDLRLVLNRHIEAAKDSRL